MLLNVFVLVSLVTLNGCGTVTPKVAESSVASFSGNDENSGILEVTENGALVTSGFVEYYNAIIEVYGNKTTPETKRDFGVTKLENGNSLVTLEGMSRLKEMRIIEDRERIDHAGSLLDKVGL